jgi:tRNA(Ile2) C34 agmatinyltransferase TiaS
MRVWACFDDTDTIDCGRGTGKLVRWYEDKLPEGCVLWGVVRQQLLVDPSIPYTSHNSSACAVIDVPDDSLLPELVERAIAHIAEHFVEGSDPGLCVVAETDPALGELVRFGRRAAVEVVTQAEAIEAAHGTHLSGHGGTDDGIIGAAAGVGLTAWGWSGRFLEYGNGTRLRDFGAEVEVAQLERQGMLVLPVDRNVVSPRPTDVVDTGSWLRPRLWGGKASVPVTLVRPGRWLAFGKKERVVSGEKAVEARG